MEVVSGSPVRCRRRQGMSTRHPQALSGWDLLAEGAVVIRVAGAIEQVGQIRVERTHRQTALVLSLQNAGRPRARSAPSAPDHGVGFGP